MPQDQRARASGLLNAQLTRLSRRVRFGVAGRILFANSVMLVGIMVLTTSLLYIQLSQLNTKREQDLLRSAAESMSLSLSLVDAQETSADGRFSVARTHEQLESMLDTAVSTYGFDIAAIVPFEFLTGSPALGSAAGPPASAASLAVVSSADTSVSALDRLAAQLDGGQVRQGRTVVRFVDDDSPGGGTMYAVSPIFAHQLELENTVPDRVVGAAVVGITAGAVRAGFLTQGQWLIGVAIATLLLGIGSSWVTSRGLRRVTGDYGATELGNMLEFYSSVLKAVSEGLVLVDRQAGIVLINAEARVLLGLPAVAAEHSRAAAPEEPIVLTELGLPEAFVDLLSSGRWARDEIHYTDDRVLVVNQQPTDFGTDTWVVTMRDQTELAELSGELVSVRSFSDSLRSQTHEYANRLHMVVSLLETGHVDEAIDFAAKDLDDLDRATGDPQMSFDHPVLSALLLSKVAQAAEVGIEMTVDTTGLTGRLGGDDRDLATVLGNLTDNAFDALSRQDVLPENKLVHVRLAGAGGAGGFTLEVSDDGPGIDDAYLDAVFERGWSTKHDGVGTDRGQGRQQTGKRGVGLSLVIQSVRRLGGAIDIQGRGEGADDELQGATFTVWLPDTVGGGEGSSPGGASPSGSGAHGNPPTGPIRVIPTIPDE